MVTKMKPKGVVLFNKNTVGDLMDRQQANTGYLKSHYSELHKKYPNYWVIISGGNLEAVEKNPRQLLKVLERVGSKDHLVYFLADPEEVMLL
jgi:hypothetical protein